MCGLQNRSLHPTSDCSAHERNKLACWYTQQRHLPLMQNYVQDSNIDREGVIARLIGGIDAYPSHQLYGKRIPSLHSLQSMMHDLPDIS